MIASSRLRLATVASTTGARPAFDFGALLSAADADGEAAEESAAIATAASSPFPPQRTSSPHYARLIARCPPPPHCHGSDRAILVPEGCPTKGGGGLSYHFGGRLLPPHKHVAPLAALCSPQAASLEQQRSLLQSLAVYNAQICGHRHISGGLRVSGGGGRHHRKSSGSSVQSKVSWHRFGAPSSDPLSGAGSALGSRLARIATHSSSSSASSLATTTPTPVVRVDTCIDTQKVLSRPEVAALLQQGPGCGSPHIVSLRDVMAELIAAVQRMAGSGGGLEPLCECECSRAFVPASTNGSLPSHYDVADVDAEVCDLCAAVARALGFSEAFLRQLGRQAKVSHQRQKSTNPLENANSYPPLTELVIRHVIGVDPLLLGETPLASSSQQQQLPESEAAVGMCLVAQTIVRSSATPSSTSKRTRTLWCSAAGPSDRDIALVSSGHPRRATGGSGGEAAKTHNGTFEHRIYCSSRLARVGDGDGADSKNDTSSLTVDGLSHWLSAEGYAALSSLRGEAGVEGMGASRLVTALDAHAASLCAINGHQLLPDVTTNVCWWVPSTDLSSPHSGHTQARDGHMPSHLLCCPLPLLPSPYYFISDARRVFERLRSVAVERALLPPNAKGRGAPYLPAGQTAEGTPTAAEDAVERIAAPKWALFGDEALAHGRLAPCHYNGLTGEKLAFTPLVDDEGTFLPSSSDEVDGGETEDACVPSEEEGDTDAATFHELRLLRGVAVAEAAAERLSAAGIGEARQRCWIPLAALSAPEESSGAVRILPNVLHRERMVPVEGPAGGDSALFEERRTFTLFREHSPLCADAHDVARWGYKADGSGGAGVARIVRELLTQSVPVCSDNADGDSSRGLPEQDDRGCVWVLLPAPPLGSPIGREVETYAPREKEEAGAFDTALRRIACSFEWRSVPADRVRLNFGLLRYGQHHTHPPSQAVLPSIVMSPAARGAGAFEGKGTESTRPFVVSLPPPEAPLVVPAAFVEAVAEHLRSLPTSDSQDSQQQPSLLKKPSSSVDDDKHRAAPPPTSTAETARSARTFLWASQILPTPELPKRISPHSDNSAATSSSTPLAEADVFAEADAVLVGRRGRSPRAQSLTPSAGSESLDAFALCTAGSRRLRTIRDRAEGAHQRLASVSFPLVEASSVDSTAEDKAGAAANAKSSTPQLRDISTAATSPPRPAFAIAHDPSGLYVLEVSEPVECLNAVHVRLIES